MVGVADVALRLGLPKSWVYSKAESGELPSYKLGVYRKFRWAEIEGLHALRHTYASLLINQGESLKYVSRQLGHASIQITADLYGHLFKETSAAAYVVERGFV